jgi:hypothetical protein
MVSEIERDLISARTKEALKALKMSCVPLGRPKGPGKIPKTGLVIGSPQIVRPHLTNLMTGLYYFKLQKLERRKGK